MDTINVNVMDDALGVVTVTLPGEPDGTYADGAMAGIVAYLNATRNHFPDAAKMVGPAPSAELIREALIDGWSEACRWHREQGMGVHDSEKQHPYKEEA